MFYNWNTNIKEKTIYYHKAFKINTERNMNKSFWLIVKNTGFNADYSLIGMIVSNMGV